MAHEVIRLDRVCRSCLREDGEMKSLFAIGEGLGQDKQRLDQMLIASTQIQVTENDGLPCQICELCRHQLYSAYSFKHMCERSDANLKRYVSKIHQAPNATGVCHRDQSGTGVKQESSIATLPGNSEIIDFNTMINADLPIIKVEAREHPESQHLGYEHDEKAVISISDGNGPFSPMNANEKFTQTLVDHTAELFNCPHCQKIFNTLLGLTHHISKHLKKNVVACSQCEKIFSSLGHLKIHMVEEHVSSPPKKSLASSLESLKKQILGHSKKKAYNCEHCERGFNKYNNYEKHQLQCEGSSYSCTMCDKTFRKHDSLIIHNKTAHGKKEDPDDDTNTVTPITVEVPPKPHISKKNSTSHKTYEPLLVPSLDLLNPEVNIKQEPLEELLEEAEREIHGMNDDDDSFADAFGDHDNSPPSLDDFQSDNSGSKPLLSLKRKVGRPRKKPLGLDSIGEKYPCNMCPKVFSSNIGLKIHQSKHTGETILFTCSVCGKSFNRSNHLKRHELIHGSIKRHKCDTCGKSFNRQDHLKKHLWMHLETKPHQCEICNKGFSRAEHLNRHKVAVHSGKEKNPKTAFCLICNRGFTTVKYLDTHMQMHTDKTFSCKLCDKTFDSKWHLKEHSKWHSNEKPFLCSECGQRFIRNDYLIIHMRRHKGEKPFKCRFCGKGFPRVTDLNVHERYHTGEKTHLCTICGKGFQRQYNLKVHLRVHTGEKPYVCSFCGKTFAQGNDLKSHVRRHTGERFNCEVCGEGFLQGYHLTQHKRSVHGIECSSHIRRVEKHLQPNPDIKPHIPTKRRGPGASQIQANLLAAQMAVKLPTELQQPVEPSTIITNENV